MSRPSLVLGLLLAVATSVFADTPVGPMNYQGRLLDNAGIPVTGSYNFVVRVYDAVSGGTLKYQEDHNAVAVDDGVYNFLVGTQTKSGGDSTWSVELWNCCANLFMEIVVNGEALSPRHRLAAAPYAFQANLALTTNNALALGGKSAGSVLADICAVTKGKWLDLVQQCLGAGSSFPGPSLVHWSMLSSSDDFSGIDFTNANISGIDFSGAYLSNSIFKNTTYSMQGIYDAGLSGTQWDGAIASSPAIYQVTNVMYGAVFKNMSMSTWDLTGTDVTEEISAAWLSACPAAIPATWQCRDMGPSYYFMYFLIGPGVNLGLGSAAASFPGLVYPELLRYVGNNKLDNANLAGAQLGNVLITQNFLNTNLTGANFWESTIVTQGFNNAIIDNTSFERSKIEKAIFTRNANGASFNKAKLDYVRFEGAMTNADFSNATLTNVIFTQPINGANFTNAILDKVTFAGGSGNITTGARLYGGTVLP